MAAPDIAGDLFAPRTEAENRLGGTSTRRRERAASLGSPCDEGLIIRNVSRVRNFYSRSAILIRNWKIP
jgi:hypothetical protein